MNYRVFLRRAAPLSLALAASALILPLRASAQGAAAPGAAPGRGAAGQGRGAAAAPAPPPTAQAQAPIDLTGYWVALVTEDWRWRMITPEKGDFASLPLTQAGRDEANKWDPDKDTKDGAQCKAYGVGGIMRVPERLHIFWKDDNTLEIDTDAGMQTRLIHFGTPTAPPTPPTGKAAEATWQGFSVGTWEGMRAGRGGGGGGFPGAPPAGAPAAGGGAPAGGGPGGPAGGPPAGGGAPPAQAAGGPGGPPPGGGGRGGAAPEGYLFVTTTDFRPGYVRKNGIPYSAQAKIEDNLDTWREVNGDQYLVDTVVITDPLNFNTPFVVSDHFRKQADNTGWNPQPCTAK